MTNSPAPEPTVVPDAASIGDSPARVLWVTGGGSGMGAAAAIAAARSGWTVAVSGRREEKLAEVVSTIQAAGGIATALPLDVTDAAAGVRAAAEVVERCGRLDGVVLAAGLNTPRRRWEDQDLGEVEAVLATNLGAVTSALHATLPHLRAAGAGIAVVISSYAGWSFQPGAGVAYSASKTALGSLVRTLNQQEAHHGVRACHLCPGDVATDFLEQRPEVPGAEARAVMLTPEDVAASVLHVLDAPAHVRVDELVISPVSQA